VITNFPKSHNRKNKIKGWQKGKFRTTKKKTSKKKKKEKKTRLLKTSSKKEEKNKNRKLTAVYYYCVAYSFALRSRQIQKERRAWRFIRRLLLLLLLRSLFSLSSWRTSGRCVLETHRHDATRISVIALSRCCCFLGIDTHCHPVDEVRLPN
jgi:hypothetical protein